LKSFNKKSATVIGFFLALTWFIPGVAAPNALIRAELDKISPDSVNAVDLCNRSRLRYWSGKYTANEAEKIKLFESSLEDSETVLASEPKRSPFYAVALLRWVAAKSELAQLKSKLVALSYLKPIEKALLKLKKIDPDLESHAADRALGRLYQLAPSFISIGSTAKAREYFSSAIAKAPSHPANNLYYAYFLFDQNEKSEAKKYVQKVLTSPDLVKYPLEKDEWLKMAQELLVKIERPA
jgi:predicted Zn-dependent protease